MALVEGKIARILSESHVVINIGAQQGVKEGMVFTILAQGDEVKDPDTGETLGRWEVSKGKIVATNVQDRLSTCEAYEAPRQDWSGGDPSTRVLSADMIEVAMRPETISGKKAVLDVNRRDVCGMPRISPVAVGDKVRGDTGA
ncbi:MAG TPA: hypothetical protein P5137_15550, partial [Candidatus Brocadiia bacterium]|nr:hypothetical protein [Candidatus Brocadiia bacterium]